eukprot:TRINITY_DN110862_c0_g1_i1.p1 TRINITY_DN110862_c0_g1~~TRINITY_DN110862_c0_g1_i1.p1  ORF type:complete len:226 (+),score=35.03 TRINITY_DN110862_c0_g1_i1:81-758(+)
MAYGLRAMTSLYEANGTGRDWFFVGDFTFRHGRVTPQLAERGPLDKMTPPAYRRANYGKPHEMRSKGSVVTSGPASAMPKKSRSASSPELANLARWTEMHRRPTALAPIPSQEIWKKQGTAPRKSKAQVDMPTGPPVSEGHIDVVVATSDPAKRLLPSFAKVADLERPKVALRYMPASTTASCHGQFQDFDERKDPLLDKYKNFSTVIAHPKRFSFTDSMKHIKA